MATRRGTRTTTGVPLPELTWRQAIAWRQRQHQLHDRAPRAAMLEVASRLCGLQAQLMSSAELALWARIDGLDKDAVSHALWEARSLVKTWSMRGTLHILPSREYSLWQAAAAIPYDVPPISLSLERLEVSPAALEQIIGAVAEALDGRQLTREEVADEVSRRTGVPALGDKLRSGWGSLLKPVAFRGQLCFAPGEGQKVRFTRPDRWIDGVSPVEPGAARLEATRRFLRANGPVPRADFARWLGLSPAEAGALLEQLGDEVTELKVEGTRAWMRTADVVEAAGSSPTGQVRLLPAFDPYVIVATGHAAQLLPGDFKGRIYRPNTWYSPVLLVDGRMDGIWSHERKGKRLEVRVEPFLELPAAVRDAVAVEAERLARFLGGALSLTFG